MCQNDVLWFAVVKYANLLGPLMKEVLKTGRANLQYSHDYKTLV